MTEDGTTPGSDRPPAETELEWRLHTMLSQRADAVDAQLTGAELRARATPLSRRHRLAPVAAAAVAVAAIAVGAAAIGLDRHHSHPLPAGGQVSGGVSSSSPYLPASPTVPSPSASPTESPVILPVRSGSVAESAVPTAPAVPSTGSSAVHGRPSLPVAASPPGVALLPSSTTVSIPSR
jgi:hypothetical protein